MSLERLQRIRPEQFPDPGWYTTLFATAYAAPIWLLVRFYLGWQWLQSGWGKVRGDNWLNNDGVALQAYWERAVAVPEQGRPPITYGCTATFSSTCSIASGTRGSPESSPGARWPQASR